ncbi:MAG: hypothetical protein LBE13_18945 [Bacteroidales bacterium]|jgi:hypothetical protein|nr:hypothetical protein [Bacteroidales bacterium]
MIELVEVKLVNPNNPNFYIAMNDNSPLICDRDQAIKTMSILTEIKLYCSHHEDRECRFLFVQHSLYKLVDQLSFAKAMMMRTTNNFSHRFKKPLANRNTNIIYPTINEKSIVNQFMTNNFNYVDTKTINVAKITNSVFLTLEDFDIYGTREINIKNIYHVFFHIANNYDKHMHLKMKEKLQKAIQTNTLNDKLSFLYRSNGVSLVSRDAMIITFKDIVEAASFEFLLDDKYIKALNDFFGMEYFYYCMTKLELIAYSYI